MTDISELSKTSDKRDHISPEGLDERIVYERRYFITLTQGGKYRLYMNTIQEGKEKEEPYPAGSIFAVMFEEKRVDLFD